MAPVTSVIINIVSHLICSVLTTPITPAGKLISYMSISGATRVRVVIFRPYPKSSADATRGSFSGLYRGQSSPCLCHRPNPLELLYPSWHCLTLGKVLVKITGHKVKTLGPGSAPGSPWVFPWPLQVSVPLRTRQKLLSGAPCGPSSPSTR